ncbi:hypothetical protein V8C40DRAFT_276098 [Trichoderma camerunense]
MLSWSVTGLRIHAGKAQAVSCCSSGWFRAVTVAARHCFVAVITRLLTDAFPFIASYQCHVSRTTSFRRQLLKRTVSFTWTGMSLVLVIALELLTDRPVVSWTIDVLRPV